MRIVRVDREELKKVLAENLEKHNAEYLVTASAYAAASVTCMEHAIANLKKGRMVDLSQALSGLNRPVSYRLDYERVIKMVEMSQDTVIELTETEFSQYVMDQWAWKDSYRGLTSSYAGKVRGVAMAAND